MDLGQRDEVVNIETQRIGEYAPLVGVLPSAGDNPALLRVERHEVRAFDDQDLVSDVLAVVREK